MVTSASSPPQAADAGNAPAPSAVPGIARPVTLWLLAQLIALVIAATQTPLSDKFIRPAERLAAQEMLVLQICAAAMLSPLLLNSLAGTIAVIATSWPMLILAGILSARLNASLLQSGLYLSAWLVVLGIWNQTLRSPRAQLAGSGVATALAVGGALLAYLSAEFGTGSAHSLWMGPVPGALAMLDSPGWSAWQPLTWLAALTLSAYIVARLGKARWRPSGEKW